MQERTARTVYMDCLYKATSLMETLIKSDSSSVRFTHPMDVAESTTKIADSFYKKVMEKDD